MFSHSKKQIVGRKQFVRSLPLNVDQNAIRHFELNIQYDSPALYVYFFRSINLLAEGTLFKGVNPLQISFPYFKKRLETQSVRSILSLRLKWRKHILRKQDVPYLVISDQWSENYYHWITQALPRLLLAKRISDDFILLLPENHMSEFHISSLSMLGINSWHTLSMGRNYYKIENLIYPSHDLQIGDYNDDLIKELASKFCLKAVDNRRVYLFVSRKSKDKRRIVNEEDVLNTFRSFGFMIVEFEELSFEEQKNLVASATILAGVHGAGLTNMIFMTSGAKVFELTTRLDGEQYYYFTLSSALGHQYFYQLCDSDNEVKTIQDSNVWVDIDKLQENLRQMIGIA